jgi:carboxyl-terminal processing protease
MPDIFIPLDTTKYSSLYGEMFRKGIFSGFTLDYMNSNREMLKAKYPTIQDFKKNFVVSDDLLKQVMDYAHKEGVEDSVPLYFSRRAEIFFNEKKELLDSLYKDPSSIQSMEQFNKMFADYMNQSYAESMQLRNLTKINDFIKEAIMFEFARNLFSYGEAYQFFLLSDETFLKAVQVMNDDKVFKKFKVSR